MNINVDERILALEKRLCRLRIIGPVGVLGMILLYLAVAIPLSESSPIKVFCVSIVYWLWFAPIVPVAGHENRNEGPPEIEGRRWFHCLTDRGGEAIDDS